MLRSFQPQIFVVGQRGVEDHVGVKIERPIQVPRRRRQADGARLHLPVGGESRTDRDQVAFQLQRSRWTWSPLRAG